MLICWIDDMIMDVAKATGKVPMTGWQSPKPIDLDYIREYIGREVRDMSDADIILIFIGIIGLLISFGSLIVAFLTFLDKRNSKKK